MSSKVLIFTSGKGGVGKTPFTIVSSLALHELGYKVVAVDMNFLNPDLYQVFLRLGAEKVDLIGKIGQERLIPSLVVVDVYGDGSLYIASRSPKYMYYPYPPIQLFKSLLALLENLGEDTIFVVDTNLNIASFSGIEPDKITYIDRLLSKIRLNFAHIITPSSLIKTMGLEELSEINQLERVINTHNKLGLNITGKKGEGIIFVFTPTVLERGRSGFLNFIYRTLRGTKEDYVTIKAPSELKEHLEDLIDRLVEPYERSTRYMSIDDLKKIAEAFNNFTISRGLSTGDVISEADSIELQNDFLVVALNHLYDPVTRTLPRNSLFIPYFVEKMINIIDVLLAANELDKKYVIERFEPIYKLIKNWLDGVFLNL